MLEGESGMTLEELRTERKPAILKIAERRGAHVTGLLGTEHSEPT